MQPLQPHEHWHIDFSFVNVGGTFYYLCSILDGASRFIVHWEIRESMKEADAEIVLQKAREKYPQARPRIISDNGPQFIAKDFKEFIRLWQASHVLTSPYYPQSNGKLERWHRTLKEQAIRPKTPLDLEQARQVVAQFVEHYNTVRLHSAIGYLAPKDKLEGRAETIWQARDEKLAAARERRRQKRDGDQFIRAHQSRLQLTMNESKNNLSIRRIGLCWEATRAPRWTRIPQAGARGDLRSGRPACGIDHNAINPGQRGKTSTKTNRISNLAANRQSDIHAEPVQLHATLSGVSF